MHRRNPAPISTDGAESAGRGMRPKSGGECSCSAVSGEQAFRAAEEAAELLAAIREGQGPPAQLFSQAEELLDKAAKLDPASTNLHQARVLGLLAVVAAHVRRVAALLPTGMA